MTRAGLAWVTAALAAGCLEAPPAATGGGGDGGSGTAEEDADPGTGTVRFPPAGAAVHVAAAIAADLDQNDHEDLVLIDDEVADDWAGLYLLRGGESGWLALDEVRLDFKPTAVRFGRQIKAGGTALVVAGASGRIAVVDYKPLDDIYVIDELTFDTPIASDISIVHTGVVTDGDPAASLIAYDGAVLWRSSPIDLEGGMTLTELDSGSILDAAFWPLRTGVPSVFVAARTSVEVAWYGDAGKDSAPHAGARTASFVSLVTGMCGTHLVILDDGSLAAGSIACDGSNASSDPVIGSLIPVVTGVTAGNLAGGAEQDIVLFGPDGDSMAGQVLIDMEYVSGESARFVPTDLTDPLVVDGLTNPATQLVAADVEGDSSAFVFAVAPDGAIQCAQVEQLTIAPCPAAWNLTGP